MASTDEDPRAGICHARWVNADLPPQWITYVIVEDLDASVDACLRGGGSLVGDVRSEVGSRYAIVRDSAGAVMGLIERPAGDTDKA